MSARDLGVAFSPEAEDDLESIARDGMETWGEAQALEYNERLIEVVQLLATFPRMGAVQAEVAPDLRSIGVGSHRIFYMLETSRVLVVRILHERMDQPPDPEFDGLS